MDDVLAAMLADLLAVAADALEPPATDVGPPERRFVSHGPPSDDCAQLAVWCEDVTPRPLDRQSCAVVPWARLVVGLTRCVSVPRDGRAPRAATLTAEASDLAVDGMALVRGVLRARREGSLFADVGCPQVDVGPLEPQTPLGGRAGWRLAVSAQVSRTPQGS